MYCVHLIVSGQTRQGSSFPDSNVECNIRGYVCIHTEKVLKSTLNNDYDDQQQKKRDSIAQIFSHAVICVRYSKSYLSKSRPLSANICMRTCGGLIHKIQFLATLQFLFLFHFFVHAIPVRTDYYCSKSPGSNWNPSPGIIQVDTTPTTDTFNHNLFEVHMHAAR